MAYKNGAPGEITSGFLPSSLRVRFAHSKFAPGEFVELFSFELSGFKFPVPPIHSGWHYCMARPERFELPTARFVAGYSIQLSYGRAVSPRATLRFARGANYPCEALDCQPFRALFYAILCIHYRMQ